MADVPLSARHRVDGGTVRALRILGERTGRDVFAELVQAFTASAPEQLDTLESAAEGDDRISVAALAHRLKGSAGSVGALVVEDLAARLEEHPVPDVEGLALIAALRAELGASLAALHDLAAG